MFIVWWLTKHNEDIPLGKRKVYSKELCAFPLLHTCIIILYRSNVTGVMGGSVLTAMILTVRISQTH